MNTAAGLQDTKEWEIKEITVKKNTSTLANSPYLYPNGTGRSGIEMLVSSLPCQASCCFSMLFLQPLRICKVPRVGPWGWGRGCLGPPPVHEGGDGGENPLERVEDFPDSLHISSHRHHHPYDQEEGATNTPHRTPNGRPRVVGWSVSRVGVVHVASGRCEQAFIKG